MKKIIYGLAVGAVLLAVGLPARAQQRAKVQRIGILTTGSPGPRETLDAFLKSLRNLGYVEEQNIIIEYRYADENYDRLPRLAAELVSLKPDVILTHSTPAALAMKQATTTIPIVIGAAGDLVQRGIVTSLARPGGNITGMTFPDGVEFVGKQLEILKDAAPKIAHVALLLNPSNPAWKEYPRNLEITARALGLRLQRVDADDDGDFEGVFSKTVKSRADGLVVANDALFGTHRKRLADLALKNRLPSVSQVPAFAEFGGFIQYGWDTPEMFRRAATYVDKILKGTRPPDLPVERPAKFELFINLKTAKQIGLAIPPNVLARADKVIK